ncbi:MAG: glutathione S-transferase C-terminal domain-containing protein [Hyphomicrobiaceae bacterium]|nr:glutathione S-transferase C-terminal domain-containing protein [Hyphomicrobiaceae bacterium]
MLRRPEALRSREVEAREELRITRVLNSIEWSIGGGQWLSLDRLTLADVVLGVAMQYMDFRDPHDWRASRPALARWAAAMHGRASFAGTLPPGFTPVA